MVLNLFGKKKEEQNETIDNQFTEIKQDEPLEKETGIFDTINEKLKGFSDENEVNETETSDIINDIIIDEPEIIDEEIKPKRKPRKQKLIISGHLFLLFLDSFFPRLFSFLLRKYEIEETEISLSETQIQQLEPFADEFANAFLSKINPAWVFLGGLVLFYGNNTTEALMKSEILKEELSGKSKKKRRK